MALTSTGAFSCFILGIFLFALLSGVECQTCATTGNTHIISETNNSEYTYGDCTHTSQFISIDRCVNSTIVIQNYDALAITHESTADPMDNCTLVIRNSVLKGLMFKQSSQNSRIVLTSSLLNTLGSAQRWGLQLGDAGCTHENLTLEITESTIRADAYQGTGSSASSAQTAISILGTLTNSNVTIVDSWLQAIGRSVPSVDYMHYLMAISLHDGVFRNNVLVSTGCAFRLNYGVYGFVLNIDKAESVNNSFLFDNFNHSDRTFAPRAVGTDSYAAWNYTNVTFKNPQHPIRMDEGDVSWGRFITLKDIQYDNVRFSILGFQSLTVVESVLHLAYNTLANDGVGQKDFFLEAEDIGLINQPVGASSYAPNGFVVFQDEHSVVPTMVPTGFNIAVKRVTYTCTNLKRGGFVQFGSQGASQNSPLDSLSISLVESSITMGSVGNDDKTFGFLNFNPIEEVRYRNLSLSFDNSSIELNSVADSNRVTGIFPHHYTGITLEGFRFISDNNSSFKVISNRGEVGVLYWTAASVTDSFVQIQNTNVRLQSGSSSSMVNFTSCSFTNTQLDILNGNNKIEIAILGTQTENSIATLLSVKLMENSRFGSSPNTHPGNNTLVVDLSSLPASPKSFFEFFVFRALTLEPSSSIALHYLEISLSAPDEIPEVTLAKFQDLCELAGQVTFSNMNINIDVHQENSLFQLYGLQSAPVSPNTFRISDSIINQIVRFSCCSTCTCTRGTTTSLIHLNSFSNNGGVSGWVNYLNDTIWEMENLDITHHVTQSNPYTSIFLASAHLMNNTAVFTNSKYKTAQQGNDFALYTSQFAFHSYKTTNHGNYPNCTFGFVSSKVKIASAGFGIMFQSRHAIAAVEQVGFNHSTFLVQDTEYFYGPANSIRLLKFVENKYAAMAPFHFRMVRSNISHAGTLHNTVTFDLSGDVTAPRAVTYKQEDSCIDLRLNVDSQFFYTTVDHDLLSIRLVNSSMSMQGVGNVDFVYFDKKTIRHVSLVFSDASRFAVTSTSKVAHMLTANTVNQVTIEGMDVEVTESQISLTAAQTNRETALIAIYTNHQIIAPSSFVIRDSFVKLEAIYGIQALVINDHKANPLQLGMNVENSTISLSSENGAASFVLLERCNMNSQWSLSNSNVEIYSKENCQFYHFNDVTADGNLTEIMDSNLTISSLAFTRLISVRQSKLLNAAILRMTSSTVFLNHSGLQANVVHFEQSVASESTQVAFYNCTVTRAEEAYVTRSTAQVASPFQFVTTTFDTDSKLSIREVTLTKTHGNYDPNIYFYSIRFQICTFNNGHIAVSKGVWEYKTTGSSMYHLYSDFTKIINGSTFQMGRQIVTMDSDTYAYVIRFNQNTIANSTISIANNTWDLTGDRSSVVGVSLTSCTLENSSFHLRDTIATLETRATNAILLQVSTLSKNDYSMAVNVSNSKILVSNAAVIASSRRNSDLFNFNIVYFDYASGVQISGIRSNQTSGIMNCVFMRFDNARANQQTFTLGDGGEEPFRLSAPELLPVLSISDVEANITASCDDRTDPQCIGHAFFLRKDKNRSSILKDRSIVVQDINVAAKSIGGGTMLQEKDQLTYTSAYLFQNVIFHAETVRNASKNWIFRASLGEGSNSNYSITGSRFSVHCPNDLPTKDVETLFFVVDDPVLWTGNRITVDQCTLAAHERFPSNRTFTVFYTEYGTFGANFKQNVYTIQHSFVNQAFRVVDSQRGTHPIQHYNVDNTTIFAGQAEPRTVVFLQDSFDSGSFSFRDSKLYGFTKVFEGSQDASFGSCSANIYCTEWNSGYLNKRLVVEGTGWDLGNILSVDYHYFNNALKCYSGSGTPSSTTSSSFTPSLSVLPTPSATASLPITPSRTFSIPPPPTPTITFQPSGSKTPSSQPSRTDTEPPPVTKTPSPSAEKSPTATLPNENIVVTPTTTSTSTPSVPPPEPTATLTLPHTPAPPAVRTQTATVVVTDAPTPAPTPAPPPAITCEAPPALVASPPSIPIAKFRDDNREVNIRVKLDGNSTTASSQTTNSSFLFAQLRGHSWATPDLNISVPDYLLKLSWGRVKKNSAHIHNDTLHITIVSDLPIDQLPFKADTDVVVYIPANRSVFECASDLTWVGSDSDFVVSSFTFTKVETGVDPNLKEDVQSVAVATTSVSAALSNPTTAMQQARVSALIALSTCEFSHTDEMSVTESPLGLKVGTEVGYWYRGALVGNAIVMISVLVLSVIFIVMMMVPNSQRKHWRTLWDSMGRLHLPGVWIVPVLVLLQGTMTAATALALHGQGEFDVAMSVCTYIVIAAVMAAVCYLCTKGFKAKVIPREVEEKARTPLRRFIFVLFLSRQKWIDDPDKSGSQGFKMHFQQVFYDYRSGMQLFLALEMFVSVLVGCLDGLKHPKYCKSVIVVFLALLALQALAAIAIRPFIAPFETFFHISISLTTVLSAGLVMANIYSTTGKKYASHAEIVGLIAEFLSSTKLVFDVIMLSRWFYSRYQRVLKKRKELRIQRKRARRQSMVNNAGILQIDECDDVSDDGGGAPSSRDRLTERNDDKLKVLEHDSDDDGEGGSDDDGDKEDDPMLLERFIGCIENLRKKMSAGGGGSGAEKKGGRERSYTLSAPLMGNEGEDDIDNENAQEMQSQSNSRQSFHQGTLEAPVATSQPQQQTWISREEAMEALPASHFDINLDESTSSDDSEDAGDGIQKKRRGGILSLYNEEEEIEGVGLFGSRPLPEVSPKTKKSKRDSIPKVELDDEIALLLGNDKSPTTNPAAAKKEAQPKEVEFTQDDLDLL